MAYRRHNTHYCGYCDVYGLATPSACDECYNSSNSSAWDKWNLTRSLYRPTLTISWAAVCIWPTRGPISIPPSILGAYYRSSGFGTVRRVLPLTVRRKLNLRACNFLWRKGDMLATAPDSFRPLAILFFEGPPRKTPMSVCFGL